ncbi:hypothetical protein SCB49_14440 [unidentified eubacterium SCB49]|nr:hypothetical protein SCB49_14440 [unidentified eubacterium SCB49]
MVYISAEKKKSLTTVTRKPYFHFLVDASQKSQPNTANNIKKITTLISNNRPLAENAQISYVNQYVNTTAFASGWEEQYENLTFEGGFFLDRAIRKTLSNNYQHNTQTYPVFVVVTDSIENAILNENFSDLAFTFPESSLFYNLDNSGVLREHSLIKNPSKQLPEVKRVCMFCESVLAYKTEDNTTVYIPANNSPSIILKKTVFDIPETEIKEKDWVSALKMQGQWNSQILHPNTSEKKWLTLVKHSFISKVMTPLTSYLVVENEAQKEMLKKKQEQALSGNKSLDLGEETQRMSEPSLIILAISFVLIVWYREKRKRRLALK